MAQAIALMRDAFVQLSGQRATVPVRTSIESPAGVALFMPSYSSDWNLFGLKMVSVFPENKRPVPVIQGKMLVMSATDGSPLGLLDAAAVTALRTGAASGLATELLAPQSASVLAVFGTGAQARTQVEGICAVRNIKKIYIKGTSRQKELDFCRELKGADAAPLSDIGMLAECDIICTATTSRDPLFDQKSIKPGVHINGIGSFKPSMCEIPAEVITHSLLVVDQRAAALEEAGDIVAPLRDKKMLATAIHAELGEIISGKKSGRQFAEQTTVFKSVGNGIQDLAIAHFLLSPR